MFSNIYYLSTLIDKSLSLNPEEKISLFNIIKNEKKGINKMIEIFEEEQKNLGIIKYNYKKWLWKIWYRFKSGLTKGIEDMNIKKTGEIFKGIKNIREIEDLENKQSEEQLENIINNI